MSEKIKGGESSVNEQNKFRTKKVISLDELPLYQQAGRQKGFKIDVIGKEGEPFTFVGCELKTIKSSSGLSTGTEKIIASELPE